MRHASCHRVIPELNYPDVSANFVVMAALGGGHPEKHKVFQVMSGWPVKPGHDSGAKIRQYFHGFLC
jgi:hypothetical protein